ncbi:RNA cap guanine-N2 methyltransferase-domain-containing protein [Crucibulum laeve]|uniref:Trimethylguanosine synthase n=1 Tax=Crucibulum laeve TaxID=68775 RepID=A0A5C3LZ62_9AGAR|nr:RNA cap guanine-N2 methyltransferase-domain-containing protein [Crucibulum laeve]
MGKRKGGGLTGIARFVFDTLKSETTAMPPIPASVSVGTRSEEHSVPVTTTPSVTRTLEGHMKRNEAKLPPTKKRRTNDGSAVTAAQEETWEPQWIDKYDATGLVPYYKNPSEVPEHLQKYFSQRTRYFSLYDSPPGCLLDEEGWYSVTPELVANQIAERCRSGTILDAFCGVGGNAIAFAKTCERVIALDTSPTRLALARHNAQIYGVADRIEFILTDYFSFAKSYLSLPSSSTDDGTLSPDRNASRKVDVIFLSPPWGGPSYLSGDPIASASSKPSTPSSATLKSTPTVQAKSKSPTPTETHPAYSLSSIQPIHGAGLFKLSRQITKNIAYFLPRNTRIEEIGALLDSDESEQVEVEEEWMGNKLKALTCYFGGLVDGQGDMF